MNNLFRPEEFTFSIAVILLYVFNNNALNILPVVIILVGGTVTSIVCKKLTIAGATTGCILGFLLFLGVGWSGIFLMGAFFLLGTTATSWGRREKEKLGLAQASKGRRNAGQVLANGGAGGVLGLIAFIFPQHLGLVTLMVAAAFSSATADTLSSELGTVYGKRFYDILNFKKGKRGSDGIISIEGLLFGIAGSIIIATICAATLGWSRFFLWIIVAGTIGNVTDSLLGATVERKGIIGNDGVNFINTAAAALFILLIA